MLVAPTSGNVYKQKLSISITAVLSDSMIVLSRICIGTHGGHIYLFPATFHGGENGSHDLGEATRNDDSPEDRHHHDAGQGRSPAYHEQRQTAMRIFGGDR